MSDRAGIGDLGAHAGHRVEQEASNPDGDEIQHEEDVPDGALVGRPPCDEERARNRGEDEPAICDRVQRLGPERGI